CVGRLENPAFFALLDENAQLLGRVQRLFHRLRLLAERAQHELRRLVEDARKGPHQPLEDEQWRHEEACDALRVREGNGPRSELAEDHVEIRDERDREDRAERNADRELDRERKVPYPGLEIV